MYSESVERYLYEAHTGADPERQIKVLIANIRAMATMLGIENCEQVNSVDAAIGAVIHVAYKHGTKDRLNAIIHGLPV